MNKIRLGLIGAGWVAQQHLNVIRGCPDAVTVGLVSRTRAKAEKLAHDFGGIPVFNDLAEMTAKARPDALMILVSADQIHPVTVAAMPLGIPLFIEKPPGLTPEENLDLAQHAKKNGVKTMVGFNRRYYSVFHKGLEMIRQAGPLLGLAVEGHERMWRVREGNTFSERNLAQWIFVNSTHTIDLLRFFGGDLKQVLAVAKQRFGEARGDQFAATVEFASGAIGNYQAHWYSPGGWRVVLYGDGMTVEFKPLESGRWTNKKFETGEIEPDEFDKKFKPGFYGQLQAFLNMVRTGEQSWPMLDLAGAYETMRLAQTISKIT